MSGPALLVIDMQRGFDHPRWGRRNHRHAEDNGARLLAHWRALRWPVVIVRHDSLEPDSPLRPGQAGNALKPGFEPAPGDLLVTKQVNSALIGTGLEAWLRSHRIDSVTIFGITTDQCVSTTARMASNLGFRTTVVEDACACFDQTSPDGRRITAEQLHLAHVTTLHTEFATVTTTDEVLGVARRQAAVESSPDAITSVSALRARLPEPSNLVQRKVLSRLDAHARAFIALSPAVIVGTHAADGQADVSPRGDAAGFVAVRNDRQLLIPERPGNRRADSLRNVIETGEIGMLFLAPGVGDALRVNGRARITTDAELLGPLSMAGKPPEMAIVVDVRESYFHCARWSHRSKLWDPTTWPSPDTLPSLARRLVDQIQMPELRVEELEAILRDMYANELY